MIIAILILLAIFVCLSEWNLRVYQRFSELPIPQYPSVSLLVPCRNEAPHIRENALSLLKQDYPDFEVIILDDDSTDQTPEILEELRRSHSRLQVLGPEPVPEGWTGKNRACHRLAKAATHEWLLFVDADTTHTPEMLRAAMQTVVQSDAALLSTFPRQRFASIGDELLVPLMFFVLLCYLPMYFVAKKTWKWAGDFSAACGQFLLIRGSTYWAIGGHEAIRHRISEAPLLASMTKARGERILLRDGSAWVSCAMYRGFRQAFGGFSRSVFASMGGSTLSAFFFLTLQTFLFHLPLGLLVFYAARGEWMSFEFWGSLAAVLAPLWIRWRIHRRVGMPARTVPLHSVSLFLYHLVILNSFRHYKFKRSTSWKGRAYAQPT